MIHQSITLPFHTIIQSLFPHRPSKIPLQNLPPELVARIFTFLSIPDKICFGLSCKHTFACLNSYLESHQRKLHQLLPRKKREILCPNIKNQPRTQFLLRLENHRWRYCIDCQRLHPPSPFHAVHVLWTRLHKRKRHCLECHLLCGQIRCMPYAGIVDICPCISITFRDKLELIQLCKDAGKILEPGQKPYNDISIRLHPDKKTLYENLQHECTFTEHPFIAVRIKTQFWISGKKTLKLFMFNYYDFETRHESAATSLQSLLMCPHKDIGSWVRRVFREGGSSFTGWDNNRSTRYLRCFWGGWKRSINGGGPFTLKVTTMRDLGNSEWPNGGWSRQCYCS